jgi:hypothetical protein
MKFKISSLHTHWPILKQITSRYSPLASFAIHGKVYPAKIHLHFIYIRGHFQSSYLASILIARPRGLSLAYNSLNFVTGFDSIKRKVKDILVTGRPRVARGRGSHIT